MNDSQNTSNHDIAKALLADRKRERFWRNFRFFVWFLLFIIVIGLIFWSHFTKTNELNSKPYVSLVRLRGIIMAGQHVSVKKVIPQLNKAFQDKQAKGVVLLINSPGGSAVQASIIHDKIIQLKHKYNKKVVVVAEDMLASGAYLIATAADKIYVNRDTITGSIGVIMSGFGFTDAIKKLGITRRVFTAGENKDRLDPFAPMTAQDKIKIKTILAQAHQNFINDVLEGRRGKLRGNKSELFSGDFWLGQTAAKLGLVDGTADLWTVLREQFDVSHYKEYQIRPSLLQMLIRGVDTELHLGLISSRGIAVQAIAPNR